jgi:hypothetical protein
MWVKKNGDSWGYESPDEEDIEVCIRSIDLWGNSFIDYYNVACQAFFNFFWGGAPFGLRARIRQPAI